MPSEFEEGVLVGLLVGEGHFGGDGRQPQVTLRMHERHEVLFRWIDRTFPGGKLYGPYDHGGRRYYQWMARGTYLREHLFPLIDRRLSDRLDAYARQRFDTMGARYARQLSREIPAGPTPLAEERADPERGETGGTTPNGGGPDITDPPGEEASIPIGRRSPPADRRSIEELFDSLRRTTSHPGG